MNFNKPPRADKKSDASEKQGQNLESDEAVNLGNESMYELYESKYKELRDELERTLEEFDLKTLNEAIKEMDNSVSINLRFLEEYNDTEHKNSYKKSQYLVKILQTIRSLKYVDIDQRLDAMAKSEYLDLVKISDSEVGLDELKGRTLKHESGNEYSHDVGNLVILLRDAVKNLAEFKYPDVIKKQLKERDDKEIEELRRKMSKDNVV